MIALDTNVLVRFLVQDDEAQGATANALIASCGRAYICREVMVELVWVLERAYVFPRERIADTLDGILDALEFIVEDDGDVAQCIHLYRTQGYGFADLMIAKASERAGADTLLTFDKKAARYDTATLL